MHNFADEIFFPMCFGEYTVILLCIHFSHRYAVEQEMLSYASGVLGQSLIDNMSGKNAIRREALEAFLNSAR